MKLFVLSDYWLVILHMNDLEFRFLNFWGAEMHNLPKIIYLLLILFHFKFQCQPVYISFVSFSKGVLKLHYVSYPMHLSYIYIV